MGITKQEGQKQYVIRRIIDAVLALLLVVAVILTVKILKGDFSKIKHDSQADDNISDIDSDYSTAESIYVSEGIDNEQVYQGSLILVNNNTEYKWNEDDLVSIFTLRNNDGSDCYSVMDNNVKLRTDAANSLNDMLKAFSSETGHTDILVSSAYRSIDEQQNLYDSAEDKSTVSMPGFSDYHTGLSVDLNIIDDDGSQQDFDGTGDYEWLLKNCHKYGFVIRYPEGKESVTGLSYRPWHFRYVGKIHSEYMNAKSLCLEEYLDWLKSFPYTGNHIETLDSYANKYEIYYFPAEFATTLTSVAVPSEYKYEISGNNSDGFVVAVYLEDKINSEMQTVPPESTDTSASE